MIKCNLRLLMARDNITRKELSEKTDIGLNSIGRYINNEFVKFDKEHMDALCKFFDCNISDLITFENEDKKKDDFYDSFRTIANELDNIYLPHHCNNEIQTEDDNFYVLTSEEHKNIHHEEQCNVKKDDLYKELLVNMWLEKVRQSKK